MVLDESINATATWASAEALAKFVQIFGRAGGDYFHVAIFGVADPSPQEEFAGFAVNEPAEANTLYAALNEEVKNHIQPEPVFQRRAGRRNTA